MADDLTGFEFGAKVLKIGVDALVDLYKTTLGVIQAEIDQKTVVPVSLMGLLKYADLLHGGAYAAPVNKLPFFSHNPAASPWYAGELRNVPAEGLGSYLAKFFGGTDAETQAAEVLMDANVPHVFPKLLSDQAYAKIIVFYTQAGSVGMFGQVSTSLSSLVESGSKLLTAAEGKGSGTGRGGFTQTDRKKLDAILAERPKA